VKGEKAAVAIEKPPCVIPAVFGGAPSGFVYDGREHLDSRLRGNDDTEAPLLPTRTMPAKQDIQGKGRRPGFLFTSPLCKERGGKGGFKIPPYPFNTPSACHGDLHETRTICPGLCFLAPSVSFTRFAPSGFSVLVRPFTEPERHQTVSDRWSLSSYRRTDPATSKIRPKQYIVSTLVFL